MLKRQLNEIVITLNISPDGPVLIKSGPIGLGTDMCFVTTSRNGNTEVYLPGSSLKGVIRSHCEKICRTLQPKSVCEPFNLKPDEIEKQNKYDFIACSQVFREDYWKEKVSYSHYSASCPACKMFGSLKFKGRCFIDDAYAVGKAPKPHIRDGIGIDRFTGATARGAKYEFEVITEGKFKTQLRLVNFEMWQLELLIFALRDLCDSNIRIGMATSRGLGKIKVDIEKIEYSQFSVQKPDKKAISDITALEKDQDEIKKYEFHMHKINVVEFNGINGDWIKRGLRYSIQIPQEKLFSIVAEKISNTLNSYLETNPSREKIKQHYYEPKSKHNRS